MKPRTPSRTLTQIAALTVGAALVTAALAAGLRSGPTQPLRSGERPPLRLVVDQTPPVRLDSPTTSFAGVVRKVTPSVVQVTVQKPMRDVAWDWSGRPGSDPFERFFGPRPDRGAERARPAPRQEGAGSGVIVSEDGYILTNHHVVDGAEEVRVRLDDERELPAKVVGRDPKTDLAVIQVTATGLPTLPLADSDQVEVGDVVLAVGNPFGLGQTVTLGIVSATGRGNLGLDYEDFIQTDAAINPGNSGGALVDSQGRLIGINTAILSRTGGNNGIGFAVPTNLARHVLEDLVRDGQVRRGFLGVMIQDLTPALAQKFGLSEDRGVLIAEVSAGTPAAEAGLRDGDVVTEYDGKTVRHQRQFRLLVAQTEPGRQVSVKVLREGQPVTLEVSPQEVPGSRPVAQRGSRGDQATETLQGVAVQNLDDRTRERLGAPAGVEGALIAQVEPGSAAQRAGLRPGDLITAINRQPVPDAQTAVRLTERPEDRVTLLRIWRDGSHRYVVVDETERG
jgi:serine protease Do